MNLRKIRKSRGLSVPQLVELSGVSRRTIQEVEARDDCRVSTAIRLADALGITLDELCREKESLDELCGEDETDDTHN